MVPKSLSCGFPELRSIPQFIYIDQSSTFIDQCPPDRISSPNRPPWSVPVPSTNAFTLCEPNLLPQDSYLGIIQAFLSDLANLRAETGRRDGSDQRSDARIRRIIQRGKLSVEEDHPRFTGASRIRW